MVRQHGRQDARQWLATQVVHDTAALAPTQPRTYDFFFPFFFFFPFPKKASRSDMVARTMWCHTCESWPAARARENGKKLFKPIISFLVARLAAACEGRGCRPLQRTVCCHRGDDSVTSW